MIEGMCVVGVVVPLKKERWAIFFRYFCARMNEARSEEPQETPQP